MKRILCVILLLALSVSLCSCGGANRDEAQQDESLSATIMPAEENSETEVAPLGWNEELTSDNGEVKVIIHDDTFPGIPETMPVIAVQPRTVTSDMAKQAASALFGDAPLYEYGWMLTRAEIEKRIAGMEKGILRETIVEEYGERATEELIEHIRSARQECLDYWREAWANSSDEVTPKECDWLFRPGEYWSEFSHDYTVDYPTYTDSMPYGFSAELWARGERDGLNYIFQAHNLERDGFWNHSIHLYLDHILGSQADAYAATGHLSDTPATDEELRKAEREAKELVMQMGFGTWQCEATNAELVTLEGKPMNLYYIVINGAQDRGGWTTPIWGSQHTQNGGGYPERMYLECTNDGILLQLELLGLLDYGEWDQTQLISLEEAMTIARREIAQWTIADRVRWIAESDAPTGLKREITNVAVGQYRMPTGELSYELIPVLCFHGIETVEGVPDYLLNDKEADFLLIDLRDGSVIDTRADRS